MVSRVHVPISLARSIFWFEDGELPEIAAKLNSAKPGYEARWEASVLLLLAGGIALAFIYNAWLGLIYLWGFKQALQALKKKRFFDPLP
jgi:hypothetical protein